MTGQEFATEYAGYRVRVNSKDLPNEDRPNPEAKVIGYNTDEPNAVIVEFVDEIDRQHSWDLKEQSIKLTVDAETLEQPNTGWTVAINELDILGLTGKDKDKRAVSPYPCVCKVCKSPARKISGALYCSNTKCKTRGKRPKIQLPSVRIIECPLCKAKASAIVRDAVDVKKHTATCQKGHQWAHDLKLNDVMTGSIIGQKDMIYTVVGWKEY